MGNQKRVRISKDTRTSSCAVEIKDVTCPGKLNTMGWRRQLSQGRSISGALRASGAGNGKAIPSPEPSVMTFIQTDSNSQHLIGGGQNLGIEVVANEF